MNSDRFSFINKERKLWTACIFTRSYSPETLQQNKIVSVSLDPSFMQNVSWHALFLTNKQQSLYELQNKLCSSDASLLHASFYLKHQQSTWHIKGFSTAICYLVRLEKITAHNTMKAIKVSYLVLVDEEKHDGQNLQEEDKQEEDEELWETQREERGQLSYLIHHLSARRKGPQGDNRHLSAKSEWSIKWREWKRRYSNVSGQKSTKWKKEMAVDYQGEGVWWSKDNRRAVDCSASIFLTDRSRVQREMRRLDNHSR